MLAGWRAGRTQVLRGITSGGPGHAVVEAVGRERESEQHHGGVALGDHVGLAAADGATHEVQGLGVGVVHEGRVGRPHDVVATGAVHDHVGERLGDLVRDLVVVDAVLLDELRDAAQADVSRPAEHDDGTAAVDLARQQCRGAGGGFDDGHESPLVSLVVDVDVQQRQTPASAGKLAL